MKKLVSIGVVVVLLFSALALVAGCSSGGDTATAQKYMKAGDALMKQAETEGQQMQATIKSAFANSTDSASYSSAVTKSKAATAKVATTAEKAKAQYQKILTLNDVSDYKKYATLQISAMNTVVQLTGLMNTYLDEVLTIANSANPTSEQYAAALNKFTTQVTALSQKISKDQAAAEKIKTEKKL